MNEPHPEEPPSCRLAAAFAFAVSLVVYLLTLAPTVTGEDSGELTSAAFTLGIPHPPGYPLWTMLTWVFLHLPFGDAAYRANLGSALTASGAVALLVFLFGQLELSPVLAAGCALLLAFSSTLWGQSVIAEVYALTLLVLIGMVYCIVRWRDEDSPGWMLGGAFLAGLSLAAHHTILLLYPLILIYVIWIGGRSLLSVSTLGKILLVFCLGLSCYLYLPIRASAHPPMNWGNPDTAQRFWAQVTRAQYPSVLGSQRSQTLAVAQVQTLGGYLRNQWPWPVGLCILLGALVGLVRLWGEDRALGLGLLAWFALMSVGFAWLLNFKLDQEAVHIAEVFFIPAWFSLVMLFATGVRDSGRGVAAVVFVLVLATVAANWRATTMAGNDVARRYARDVLSTLPANAILFTSADYEAFPVIYLQVVEKQRPDVAELDEERDVGKALNEAGLVAQPGEDPLTLLLHASKRPIYSTRVLPPVEGTVSRPVGLLYRTFPDATSARQAETLDGKAWKSYGTAGPEGPWVQDWSTASLLGLYDVARARSELAYHPEKGTAKETLARAAARLPGDPVYMNSLGALLTRAGRSEESAEYYRKAVRLDPAYVEATFNLISALISSGQSDEARQLYNSRQSLLGEKGRAFEEVFARQQLLAPALMEAQSAVSTHPDDGEAYLRLAAIESRLLLDRASDDLRKAVERNPRLEPAWVQLGVLRAQKNDLDGAASAWKTALHLQPRGADAPALQAHLRALGFEP